MNLSDLLRRFITMNLNHTQTHVLNRSPNSFCVGIHKHSHQIDRSGVCLQRHVQH